MPEKTHPNQICPFLGLVEDRASRFSYPEAAHVCFAAKKAQTVSIEHQTELCFTSNFPTCARFVAPAAQPQPAQPGAGAPDSEPDSASPVTAIIWGVVGLVTGLLVILAVLYYSRFAFTPSGQAQAQTSPAELAGVAITPDANQPAAGSFQDAPDAASFLATPTPTMTPQPGTDVYTLSPDKADIGWGASSEERGNHLGDSYLYAGVLDGQIYQSIFQLKLSDIPRGAPIYSAVLELTGLRDEDLNRNNDQSDAEGVWAVRLLAAEIDQSWRQHTFQDIFNAPVEQTLQPLLSGQDLAAGRLNAFELTSPQIDALNKRILDSENPTVSFRIDGPLLGPNNLFAWDSGYGPQSENNKVVLRLEVGEPPATPPPYDYIVVTSTPTPENVVTAAAIALQMTADVAQFGTPTPPPPNMVTATPFPEGLILTPTPTPENTATAEFMILEATAIAFTTGTPPPIPTNAITATPTPTATPTATGTPTPTFVVITLTPTPESVLLAATTIAASGRLEATPLPDNWATPIVVTSTPTPLNAATAQAFNVLATAMALTTGTPTPTPNNVVTATPTPVYEIIPLLGPPSSATPTPIPEPIPAILLGKILFKSDRMQSSGEVDNRQQEEVIYVYDPQTGQLGRLTSSWPYEVALQRDTFSADQRFRVYTKDFIRYKNVGRGEQVQSVRDDAPAVYWYDSLYQVEQQLTNFGAGIAYNGVWSPTSAQIAFVSNDSGDDEIWVANLDGSDMRQLTSSNTEFNAQEIGKDTFVPELSKYPSWSPDGQQIVFASTRTGNYQLWIMNADGSDQRLLMGWDNWTPYNDSGPVWVKYLDPPRPVN